MLRLDIKLPNNGFSINNIESVIDQIQNNTEKFFKENQEDHNIILLSGRIPMWLTAAAVAKLVEFDKSIATYDPNKNIAIIAANPKEYKLGDNISLEEVDCVKLTLDYTS